MLCFVFFVRERCCLFSFTIKTTLYQTATQTEAQGHASKILLSQWY